MLCEATILNPGLIEPFALYLSFPALKCSLLVNCPGGVQRIIGAAKLRIGTLRLIVVTSFEPRLTEGLPGLLMTVGAGRADDKGADVRRHIQVASPHLSPPDGTLKTAGAAPHPPEYYSNMNCLSLEPFWGGSNVLADADCAQQCACDSKGLFAIHREWLTKAAQHPSMLGTTVEVELARVSAGVATPRSPVLTLVECFERKQKVDKAKLAALHLSKDQMRNLFKDGSVDLSEPEPKAPLSLTLDALSTVERAHALFVVLPSDASLEQFCLSHTGESAVRSCDGLVQSYMGRVRERVHRCADPGGVDTDVTVSLVVYVDAVCMHRLSGLFESFCADLMSLGSCFTLRIVPYCAASIVSMLAAQSTSLRLCRLPVPCVAEIHRALHGFSPSYRRIVEEARDPWPTLSSVRTSEIVTLPDTLYRLTMGARQPTGETVVESSLLAAPASERDRDSRPEAVPAAAQDDERTLLECSEAFAQHGLPQDDGVGGPGSGIYLLGTGASVPSRHRNVSAYLCRLPSGSSDGHGFHYVLIDCGESMLYQILRTFSLDEAVEILLGLRYILVTHNHADHFLGIPTFLRAISAVRGAAACRSDACQTSVVMPPTVMQYVRSCFDAQEYSGYEGMFRLMSTSDLQVNEGCKNLARQYQSLSHEDFNISIFPSLHIKGISVGFVVSSLVDRVQFCFSGDTRPCSSLVDACHAARHLFSAPPAEHSTFPAGSGTRLVLVHDSTFDQSQADDAAAKFHSTSNEAYTVAVAAQADVLVLTHFSQRYSKTFPFVSEELVAAPSSDPMRDAPPPVVVYGRDLLFVSVDNAPRLHRIEMFIRDFFADRAGSVAAGPQ